MGDLVSQPAGHSGNVRTGSNTSVDFFFQIVDLRVAHAVLVGAVEVMVRAVVMDGIAAQIAVFIHIPSAVIHVPFSVKAVPDVDARNFLITHAAAVPKPQITDNENRTGGELNVQIGALIVQIEALRRFRFLDKIAAVLADSDHALLRRVRFRDLDHRNAGGRFTVRHKRTHGSHFQLNAFPP